jgi:hypothetical protein
MEQESELIAQVKLLSAQLAQQNSFWQALMRGVFYGVGFVIGSAVLAVLVIGVLLPFVKDIPGVQEAFINGVSIIRGGQ